ncbi:kinesin family member 4/21/27 [Paragonimus westermani]|uniref:Kinesin family member 4/21/27 n=1 Tax=Paragonimus westermani TaxID=34504 RepID=A0A5J4NLT8_9TREM|nr:kinesin family member 4/21/27 [Paragonimus westermani]
MAVDNDTSENDSTSVRVAVRVRPQSSKEKLAMSQICTTVAPNTPQIILGKDSCFTFDCVFNIHSNQEQIFQSLAKPLIDGCMSGYNATILAYGQTGSGKTYTMGTGFDLGSPNLDAGIIPRAVQYLFSRISQCRSQAAAKHEPVPEFKVVAQFLEVLSLFQ